MAKILSDEQMQAIALLPRGIRQTRGLEQAIDSLAECKRLLMATKMYIRHAVRCRPFLDAGDPCSCGAQSLLDEIAEAMK